MPEKWARGVFLAVAVATAVAAPWMLGSEPVAAQWMLLWGALATFVAGRAVRLLAAPRYEEKPCGWVLAGSLVFGAALLTEIALQVANPSHTVVTEGALWRLVPLRPEPILPQGIAGRFHEGGDYIPFKNPACYALILGAAWCYAAGLVFGLRQRADARCGPCVSERMAS